MKKIFIIFLATATIALMPLNFVYAESLNLNLQITGIECDLEALSDQLGYIPEYCSNRPSSEPAPVPIDSKPNIPNQNELLGGLSADYTLQSLSGHQSDTVFTSNRPIIDRRDTSIEHDRKEALYIILTALISATVVTVITKLIGPRKRF